MRANYWTLRIAAIGSIASLIAAVFILMPRGQSASTGRVLTAHFSQFAVKDAATSLMRRRETRLYKITPVDGHSSAEFSSGMIMSDHGTFKIAVSSERLVSTASFDVERLDQSIYLPSGKIDPLAADNANSITQNSKPDPNGKGYYIVQFGTVITDELLDSLRDIGVEPLQYVPDQAYLVYAKNDAIVKASEHSRVRWIGSFLPEHKSSKVLKSQLAFARDGQPLDENISPVAERSGYAAFDIAVFSRADLSIASQEIASQYGGKILKQITLPNNYFNIIRAELPIADAERIADIPDVIRIDSYGKPAAEDERAAQIVAGNYISTTTIASPGYDPLSQFGTDGTNVTVSMVDDGVKIPGNGGFWITASNTVNGPLRGASPGATGGHGHLNASIVAGYTPFGAADPTGYNYGLGVAPRANIINIPLLTSGYTGSEADTYNDTVITAGPNGVTGSISNNSWGNGTNSNAYDAYTASFDGFVRDASASSSIDPISLIFSAGNSGPSSLTLTRPKAAKNIIAVGNTENLRTELGSTSANNIDDLNSTSSRGPTADGRVKPDVCAPGSYVTGSGAGDGSSIFGFVSGTSSTVGYSSGTSHAAPQVAGAAALFTNLWKNNNGGANPSPALIKAAVINTAQDMNSTNTTGAIPNGNEGWGRINMKYMFPSSVSVKRVDQTMPLSNVGETAAITGTVGSASEATRVTLVWSDPPALADPALVNDLDLTVTIGANVYKGNVFTNGVSTTGGAADTKNNVENVFLPAGIAAGTPFKIEVKAAALNGDGILGNSDTTDQNFGLVAYNFNSPSSPSSPTSHAVSDFDGDGRSDISVWRSTDGVWYSLNSSNNAFTAVQFGTTGDQIVPGDYDGDGKTDRAVWRPGTGVWYINASTAGFYAAAFGSPGDIPAQGDFDGDGKTDLAVFRPSTGGWYLQRSTAGYAAFQFGSNGDVPAVGDHDGDGKADIAVFRPSTGVWYIQRSAQGFMAIQFGSASDKVVPADIDGDGKTDQAVFRDGTWFINGSTSGFSAVSFGLAGDIPASGDFDGDGRSDIAVYRPSAGAWYKLNSTNGQFAAIGFGNADDIPTQSGYVKNP